MICRGDIAIWIFKDGGRNIKNYPITLSFAQVLSVVHPSRAGPIVWCHTCCRDPHVNTPGSPIPWPFLRRNSPVRPEVQCPWPPTSEAGPLWGKSLTHCLYGQTVHPWLKRPTRYHRLHLELGRATAVPLATPGEIRSRPQILARDWSAGK